jgi:para-aminobenzoate synthetase/4-amino-4-deoxychorismate lyase
VYEQARAACGGCSDVLLWNERGELTESDSANLAVRLDGRLVTPPVSCGLLPGVFRQWLLDRGELYEQIIRLEDLSRCEEIYLINSVRKWRRAILI